MDWEERAQSFVVMEQKMLIKVIYYKIEWRALESCYQQTNLMEKEQIK